MYVNSQPVSQFNSGQIQPYSNQSINMAAYSQALQATNSQHSQSFYPVYNNQPMSQTSTSAANVSPFPSQPALPMAMSGIYFPAQNNSSPATLSGYPLQSISYQIPSQSYSPMTPVTQNPMQSTSNPMMMQMLIGSSFGTPISFLPPFLNNYEIEDQDPGLANPRFLAGQRDISASNGFIQGIDRVLLPTQISPPSPTIADIVAQSGGVFDNNGTDYDLLLNAVQTAGLTDALSDPDADLTVLAPTDNAFMRLASDLGAPGSTEEEAFNNIVDALTVLGDGDPIPLLNDILTYHVLPEGLEFSELTATTDPITTLNGETVNINRINSVFG